MPSEIRWLNPSLRWPDYPGSEGCAEIHGKSRRINECLDLVGAVGVEITPSRIRKDLQESAGTERKSLST